MIINCDLIIKNGKVFEKNKFKKNHIVIKNGKIFKLTKNIKLFKSKKTINADNKIVTNQKQISTFNFYNSKKYISFVAS